MALALAVGLSPLVARAGEPAAAGAGKTPPDRVHLGAASVTVVDEHEPVDDVITRIRSRRTEPPPAPDKDKHGKGRARGTVPPENHREGGRAGLRGQRDRATERDEAGRGKEERRERAASTRARLEGKGKR